jgi:hypothetical protein
MKEIESLKKVIIDQLKNGEWKSSYDNFYNKYFKFDNTSSGWRINVKLNETYKDDPEIKLEDIMSIWHFYYLKIFYVNKSMRNSDKRENLKKISEISKKFLDKNKDISRDSKLNEILS